MKEALIFLAISFSLSCCNDKNLKWSEWNRIKHTAEFGELFEFTLEVEDTLLLEECIRSLSSKLPRKSKMVLMYHNYFQKELDSLERTRYALMDFGDFSIDYGVAHELVVVVDSSKRVNSFTKDSAIDHHIHYLKSYYSVFDTTEKLGYYKMIYHKGKSYQQRLVEINLINNMPYGTYINKKVWLRLIDEWKKCLKAYDDIRHKTSISHFGKTYSNLSNDELLMIKKILPVHINMYFTNYSLQFILSDFQSEASRISPS